MPVNRKCEKCGKLFYAKPAHIKKGWGKYCSSKCQYESAKTGKLEKCYICEKLTYRALCRANGSKSGKYFCSKSCQTKWRNVEFSGNKSLKWKDGKSTYRKVMLKSAAFRVCMLCKEGDSRILAVHHIDQNRKNYKVENLAWLCHNCHRLVHYDKVMAERFAGIIGARK
jgi:hypothetical protein